MPSPPAFATNAPGHGDRATYESLDETTRVTVLMQLANSGHADEADALLAAYPLTGPYATNRTLFLEGLILRAKGDLEGAVAKYRQALAADPGLTLVRSELANTLAALGETDSAKHHLELLAGSAETQEQARGVRAFIDRIDASKPYSVSAYLSASPSTNINSGSNHTTVYNPGLIGSGDGVDWDGTGTISDDARKRAGFLVTGGVQGAYNWRLSNDFAFVAAGGADALFYDDRGLSAVSLSQSLELRHIFVNGYFGLGAVASQSFDVDNQEIGTVDYGPRVSIATHLSTKDSLSASAAFLLRDFDVDGHRDGTSVALDASLSHVLDSATKAMVYAGFDQIDNGADWLSYTTISGGLQVYRELPYGVSLSLGAEVRRSAFDGRNILLGVTREDMRYIAGATLTKRDWNLFGFAPALNYTYVRNTSNSSVYDYDSHSVDFRLTKDF